MMTIVMMVKVVVMTTLMRVIAVMVKVKVKSLSQVRLFATPWISA